MKMKRRYVWVWLGALLAGALAVSAAGVATTTAPATMHAAVAPDKPSPRMINGKPSGSWLKRHEEYAALAKKGGIDLYFVGDSITDFWQTTGKAVWDKEFSGWKPANFGISGDRTESVLYRLENGELEGVKPKVFVVMIGTNNVGNCTPEQIAAGNAAIVKKLQATNPQAKILLLAVFPRWSNKENHVPQPRITEINVLLAKLDDGKNVKYLDIGSKFLVDGKLPADVMPDGLHPNARGYQIWADAIKPVLTEWLGPMPATQPAKGTP